ncbi:hypothetical protein [Ruegeria meonggei]|uniref:hypothetical protein n=1 Tax=Ruegeria meonggei TaxID=1446476 RepID=UPI00366F9E2D
MGLKTACFLKQAAHSLRHLRFRQFQNRMNKMATGKDIIKAMVLAAALGVFSISSGSVLADTKPDRHPVNCATAEGDLRAIAAEKKHAQDQQVESVISILPAGALLGLVTGTEDKRLSMLSGDYVKALDERAAEIKSTCGVK